MKIFLLSSSYTENTFIMSLNSLFANPVDEVYVLYENHQPGEFDNIKNCRIIMVKKIIDALSVCDAVFIIEDNLYKPKIGELESISRVHNCKFIHVSLDETKMRTTESEDSYNVLPVILILSIGRYNQVNGYELYLQRMFTEHSIRVSHEYSQITENTLRKLENEGLLNSSYRYYKHAESNVIIKTIEIDSLFDLYDIDLVLLINKIKPDYSIVLTQRAINSDDTDVSSVIKYRFGILINKIFESDYYAIPWQHDFVPVLYKNELELLPRIYNEKKAEGLIIDILNHVSYPDGIQIVHK